MPNQNGVSISKHSTGKRRQAGKSIKPSDTAPLFTAADMQSSIQAVIVTKRALSDATLRDSEARFRRLFETSRDGILILDATSGCLTDVNPFLVKLLDYSREEFLGKALWDIGPFKDIEASKTAFRELQTKRYIVYDDLPLKTKSGRSINVEFVSTVYGVNRKKVIHCNIRDITKRKHAEQSGEQLRQMRKMEAIGQLAGGMAHDFNNILGVILGYCELLATQPHLEESSLKMIAEINKAGISATNLTRPLLAFSRRQVLKPVFVDLNATVQRLETMLDRMIGDDIEVRSVLSASLGTIKADPSQIEQVLMNLAVNARDAMPKGGRITITTANVKIDATFSEQHLALSAGKYVVLTVSDTGTGMDQETQSRIFEPFFSTKGAGKGTGLGLSTVFGIVQQSKGTIGVYSELGHGTTFKIYFPLRQEPPATPQHQPKAPLRGGSETVLLVDDATPLRELTRRLLQDRGYKILDTADPLEAIRIAKRHKGPIPLMITDVVMPGFSGTILAERIAASRPETKVLYISGYADDEVVQQRALGPDCGFLEKPFRREDLLRKVRDLLDTPMHQVLNAG